MRAATGVVNNQPRLSKESVQVTVYMNDGAVMSGELFVLKTGQRLQDLLNDNARRFLPLKTSGGMVTFINRDFLKMIAERRDGADE